MTSDPSVTWRERESRQTSQWTRQRALNRHWFSSPFNLTCQHRDWEKEIFLFIKLPGLRHFVAVAQVDGYIPLILLVVSLAFKDGIISLAPSHPFKSVKWWDYSCDDVMMESASRILRVMQKGQEGSDHCEMFQHGYSGCNAMIWVSVVHTFASLHVMRCPKLTHMSTYMCTYTHVHIHSICNTTEI